MVTASFLFIGADRIAVVIGGMYFRLVAVPLILATFFFRAEKGKSPEFDNKMIALFLAFIGASIVSMYDSYDAIRSVAYTVWVVFIIIFLIPVFYNYGLTADAGTVIKKWFLIYRIHAIFACLQVGAFAFGLDIDTWTGRARLWFYESSLLGFFLSGYFVAALYLAVNRHRKYWWDVALALASTIATTSVFEIAGLAVGSALVLLTSRRGRLPLLAVFSFVVVAACTIVTVFHDELSRNTNFIFFLGWILNVENFDMLTTAIIYRSGFRVLQVAVGWDAFLHHPLTGIGIGADHTYFRVVPVPDDMKGLMGPWWWKGDPDIINGMMFSNFFVEVLGMLGIVGFVPFALIVSHIVSSVRGTFGHGDDGIEVRSMYYAIFVMIALLQIDCGGFLRFDFWSVVGLALGATEALRRKRAAEPALGLAAAAILP